MDRQSLKVGDTDKKGSILVLGGQKVSLWKAKNNLYFIGDTITISPTIAVREYNKANNTKLEDSYIEKYFEPWYQKHARLLIDVPSRSENGKYYSIRKEVDGSLTCECPGFRFRKTCWHIEAVQELLEKERE
jgi:hypothetical protein